jgi:23S rRNA (uridine2552-2'-O)-methyltransferase
VWAIKGIDRLFSHAPSASLYQPAAQKDGLRSRAAYKLMHLDDKYARPPPSTPPPPLLTPFRDRYRFLRRGQSVVDLGAAPGGWSLVAAQRVGAPAAGRVIGVDLLPGHCCTRAPRFLVSHLHAVASSPSFTSIIGDFTDAAIRQQLMDACGGNCDVVLCDAAPNSSGQQWCAS